MYDCPKNHSQTESFRNLKFCIDIDLIAVSNIDYAKLTSKVNGSHLISKYAIFKQMEFVTLK